MRVIAGTARSLKLVTPEGTDTRPTTDRIKETLFNMLQFDLQDAAFLDLFAGSGAIGIEALSRGASYACFVDSSTKAEECIKNNLTHTKFIDKELEQRVLEYLGTSSVIDADTTIIFEAALDTDLSFLDRLPYEVIKIKQYKTNMHVFVKRSH